MRKKIPRVIFSIAMLGIVVGFISLVALSVPYYFYHQAINANVSSQYFDLNINRKKIKRIISPTKSSFIKMNAQNKKSAFNILEMQQNWTSVHFGNFNLNLPVEDINYLILPKLTMINQRIEMGLIIKNLLKETVFDYSIKHKKRFVRMFIKNKIFKFPYFKNFLLSKPNNVLWQDIFSKNVNFENIYEVFSIFKIFSYFKYSYKELVYNLFILKHREHFYNNGIQIHYYKHLGQFIGIVKKQSLNKYLYDDYYLYILKKEQVYTIKISIKRGDLLSQRLKKILITSIELNPSTNYSNIEFYSKFTSLPYDDKVSQKGMLFLYAAWSHTPDNIAFLKQMIFWLERRSYYKDALKQLYKFAYKNYHTNFSTKKEYLMESSKIMLERRVKEEQKLLLKESNSRDDTIFSSPEEEVLYKASQADKMKKTDNNNP